MCNSWGAHKVTFANEWFEIANIFGVNYDELRELFVLDTRVEKIHTAVLKSKRGFGGKCFPKDVNAIVKATEKAGYSPELLKQVLKSNDEFIKKNIS
jgi:UDPglucose 6-dehydrogenase